MSNTTTVSPYASDTKTSTSAILMVGAAATAVGVTAMATGVAVAGVAALAGFLSKQTVQDREAVTRLKEQQRRERLAAAGPTEVVLHIPDVRSLIRAAQGLGYRAESLVKSDTSLSKERRMLLKDNHGQQMVLSSRGGKLVVSATGGIQEIQSVVRQHTLEAVSSHFGTKWTGVKIRKLANGIVEIEAKESDVSPSGGAAKVRAQVLPDGKVHLDIDEVKGNRCEKILSELARSVGGEPTKIEKKPAFWQLPGKKTKSNIKV